MNDIKKKNVQYEVVLIWYYCVIIYVNKKVMSVCG